MNWDVDYFRSLYPAFKEADLCDFSYFDNAGGSYICQAVYDKLTSFLRHNKIQGGSPNLISQQASEQMQAGRDAIAGILNVPEQTLTFGPSTTQNVNTLANACEGFIGEGDEIIISHQDHEANIGAWRRLAERSHAKLRVWNVNPKNGELDLDQLNTIVNSKTKLITLCHVSNILGSINPIADVVQIAKKVQAKVVVDGVAYAPHYWPDIPALEVDAYLFSTYKTSGPHTGVMFIKDDFLNLLKPQCHYFNRHNPSLYLDSSGPNHSHIASLAGLTEHIEAVHRNAAPNSACTIQEKAFEVNQWSSHYELQLSESILEFLQSIPHVQIFGKPQASSSRVATLSFSSSKISSAKLNQALGNKNIGVKHGHFYSLRLLESLNLQDPEDGVLRLSLYAYNTKEEVDRLISECKELLH